MVEITKEDVLDWYKGLNASHRVEVVCALLDHSLPFELRFLGSVIENFGRKDFHILRDAENKANSLHTSGDVSPDVSAILKMLAEGPAPANITVNPQMVGNTGGQQSHSTTTGTTSEPRPSPTLVQDQQRRTTEKLRNHVDVGSVVENGLPNSKSSTPRSLNSNSEGKDSERTRNLDLSNHADVNSEEETGPRNDLWLHDGVKRRKLILYLSLMSATNHDSANLYFLLLSDVQDLSENLDWLEELEESAQDEILLLYTIGSHHPAFNFEQRTLLASVINRFKDCMERYSKDCDSYHHPSQYNQMNQHYFPQQFIYYPSPQMMQPNQTTNPNNQALGSHVVTEGGQTPAYYHYTQYSPYPIYMTHPHPSPSNPQQCQTHPYPGGMIPIQNSLIQPQVGSQPILPTVSATSSQNSANQQLPVKSQNPHVAGPQLQPHSHQSSVSTPSRNSSMASAVTAFQSQPNSVGVDGDSEGSSENCAWDSPESSPFESPPQSLTPSRSQSPKVSQTKSAVHLTGSIANSGSNFNTQQSGLRADAPLNNPGLVNCAGGIVNPKPYKLNYQVSIEQRGRQAPGPSSQNIGQSQPPSVTSISVTKVSTTSHAAGPPSGSTTANRSSPPSKTGTFNQANATNPSAILHSTSSIVVTSFIQTPPIASTVDSGASHKPVPPPSSLLLNSSSSNATPISSSAYSCMSTLSTNCNTAFSSPLPQHHLVNQPMVNANANHFNAEAFYNGTHPGATVGGNPPYQRKGPSVIHSQQSQLRLQQQKPIMSVGPCNQSSPNNQMTMPPSQQHHLIQSFMQPGQMQPSSIHSVPGGTHSVVINSSTPGYGHPSVPTISHMSHVHQTSAGSFPGFQPTSYGSVVSPGVYRANNQAAMMNRPGVYMTNHGSVMNNQQNNLMNYSLPFSIPAQQLATANYNKQFLNSPNNLLSKDPTKNSLPNFVIGSGDTIGLIPQPSLSPMMNNPPRSRSFAGETGLPIAGNDFPAPSSVENALVPGLDDPIDVSCRPRKISCYNCGSNKHVGQECKELSMEEMTKMQYRLNYGGDTNDGE